MNSARQEIDDDVFGVLSNPILKSGVLAKMCKQDSHCHSTEGAWGCSLPSFSVNKEEEGERGVGGVRGGVSYSVEMVSDDRVFT